MKLNVKGLVFVGFAAAILSANAMAATGDEKIVTSKAFTEATYQAKTGANNNGKVLYMKSNEAGDIGYMTPSTMVAENDSNVVTSGAVYTAIAGQGLGSTYEVLSNKLDDTDNKTIATNGNSTTLYPSAKAVKTYADSKVSSATSVGSSTTVAPNEKAVSDALATKQANLTGTSSQVTLGNATYKDIETNGANVTTTATTIPTSGAVADAITAAIGGQDFTGYEVKSDKAASITEGEGGNASSTTKYASTAAVTGYAQKKLGGTSADAGKVVTASATAGEVTYTQLATVATSGSYADLSNTPTIGDATLTVSQNGVSAGTFGANATSAGSVAILAPDWDQATAGAADFIKNKPTISNAASGITAATSEGSAKELATTYAVKQYVASYAPSIPAVPTSGDNACDASHPCALVSDGGTPAWVRMAQ